MLEIYIYKNNVQFRFNEKNKFLDFLKFKYKKYGFKNGIVSYTFTNDRFIQQINKKYLNHNYPTDIITFNLSEKKDFLIADIYISIETIKRNSKLYNVTFTNELQRVMFHGLLHLYGFNDDNKTNEELIRKEEDKLLLEYKKVSRETSK